MSTQAQTIFLQSGSINEVTNVIKINPIPHGPKNDIFCSPPENFEFVNLLRPNFVL